MTTSNRHPANTPHTLAQSSSSSAVEPGVDARKRPFHHGSLPNALLEAAEAVLVREGIKGLTLRAIAREAGVSHTAPKHHFGDVANVLSELAAVGHVRLAQQLAQAAGDLPDGDARRRAIAHGYVKFGVQNPGLFRLMDRHEMLDDTRESLLAASRLSALALAGVFESPNTENAPQPGRSFAPLSTSQAVSMTAAWAYVHGLTSLLIDNRLEALVGATDGVADALALVEAVIDSGQVAIEPPTGKG